MQPKSDRLIWIDLEMTGLNTDTDHIIEIAVVVTDSELNLVCEGPNLVLHQPDSVLSKMDNWNTRQHQNSGLTEQVRSSVLDDLQAQAIVLEFLMPLVLPQKSPMCGNTICQDRRFLHRGMPQLERYFHYRNLDVSSVKELATRWYNIPQFKKESRHRALEDIYDSIAELKYYREKIFVSKS